MKNIRFKFIGVLILVALILGSCKKWIDTGINVNPDAPIDVPMKSLLPSIQANMAFNTIGGNDIARVTSIWVQYFQGISRQSQGTANYIWKDADVDNQWNTNYSFTMMNLVQLTTKAKTAKNMMYLGIADVLMAEALGITTDVWGDMPFSDAFQGLAQLNPKFDSQQQIYATIISLLDEAITSLSSETTLPYADGDLMYGQSGDAATQASLWLKAAHGMKARYLLHLCKRDATNFQNALNALTGCLASNDDDLQFGFGTGPGNQNPLFQFMDQRGDVAMHQSFIDTLLFRQDPRIAMFATNGGGVNPYQGVGWNETTTDSTSYPGVAVAAEDAPVQFLTYAECMFIKAECEHVTGVDPSQVRADLVEGLTASMKKWGVYSAIYIQFYTAAIQNTTGDALYREIMMQKYFALYHQAESFADWRRTENRIGLPPNPNPPPAPLRNEIPRRFPYSLGEKSYNPSGAAVYPATLWDRVWWDVKTGGE